MQRVQRDSLLDYLTYQEQRDERRTRALEVKAPRRIHVGGVLTFLFENTETIRYQVQEMMRAERIVREADIEHELATYNELLGGPGELGCTLLIELDDPAVRDEKLRAWLSLPERLYVEVEGGQRVRALFDPRQIGEERLSSVQYLKFPLEGRPPLAVGADHPDLTIETRLDPEQRAALQEDLTSGREEA